MIFLFERSGSDILRSGVEFAELSDDDEEEKLNEDAIFKFTATFPRTITQTLKHSLKFKDYLPRPFKFGPSVHAKQS